MLPKRGAPRRGRWPGDQEQEDHRHHEGEDRGTHRGDQMLAHRRQVDAVAGGLIDRESLPRLRGDAVGCALRTFEKPLLLSLPIGRMEKSLRFAESYARRLAE